MSGAPPSNPNLSIYAKEGPYVASDMTQAPDNPWDARLQDVRFELIHRHLQGQRGLDVCCGTGLHLPAMKKKLALVVGLDFAHRFLEELPEPFSGVQGDALQAPFPDNTFDAVCCFKSIYSIPGQEDLIQEFGRITRPGGRAVLEFGNRNSLNFPLTQLFHQTLGWAIPHALTVGQTRRELERAGFNVLVWKPFQILPMYGVPPGHKIWLLVGHPKLKRLMGLKLFGRNLDEWLCAVWPFKALAFRHLVVVEKTAQKEI